MSLALQETATQGTSLTNLCQMTGISRACYYRGLSALDPVDKDIALRESIQQVALDCSCYGYRRVTHELHRQGIEANHKRVLRLMREDNLLCLRKKRFVATTNSDHRLPVYPNLAAEMDITAPDQLWVSDLTYIRLGHEFIYLAVVLDACSRRCLGWSLGRRLDAALATSALRMALKGNSTQGDNTKERKPQVHHSDRGVQYASAEYTSLLQENDVQISMPPIKP
jgi:putative transposase